MTLADKVLVHRAGGLRDQVMRTLRRANLVPVKPGEVIEAVL